MQLDERYGDLCLPDNSFNPIIQASLIASQHLRPVNFIGGILLPGSLLASSYVSVAGYKKDAAGIIAAQSGLYILLASRRRWVCCAYCNRRSGQRSWLISQRVREKLSPRGIIRGGTLALCALNVVACGISYTFGDRAKEEIARQEKAAARKAKAAGSWDLLKINTLPAKA